MPTVLSHSKNFSVFYGIRVFVSLQNSFTLVPTMSQMNPLYILTPNTFKTLTSPPYISSFPAALYYHATP
jgi:hypothetical protein